MPRKLFCMLLIALIFGVSSLDSFSLKDLGKSLEKNLKKVGKTVVIAGLIRKVAPELNNFINGLLLNKGVANRQMTKVVPIFGLGTRSAVGGAQVSGSAEKLAQVRAVIQVDGRFHRGKFRVKAFVPTTSSTKLDRVYGVGVTAIIDYHVR